MAGLLILAFFVAMAIYAVFASKNGLDPTLVNGPRLAPPSLEYPLGTDDFGVSVLTQVVQGSKISLLVGLAATVMSIAIGALGRDRGRLPRRRLRDPADAPHRLRLVVPWLALAIVLASIIGPSLVMIILVIGLTSWPGTARLVRAQVLSIRERPYVERARALGGGHWHMIGRHVLPNVMPVILANTVLTVAIAILSESALSFLGLGDPFSISWGAIIE